jgi:hypothetical protein
MAKFVAAIDQGTTVANADWNGTFDPARRGIFQGRSPYEQLFVIIRHAVFQTVRSDESK